MTDCVVLTENYFLYEGIKCLLNDRSVIRLGYKDIILPECLALQSDKKILVIIDNSIFFQGVWDAFCLLADRQSSVMLWLVADTDWNFFPTKDTASFRVCYGEKIDIIKKAFTSCCDKQTQTDVVESRIVSSPGHQPEKGLQEITTPYFPDREKRIMIDILSGYNAGKIARKFTKPYKRIYDYRLSIKNKFGFKSISFMSFIYRRNQHFLDKTGINFS